MGELGVARQADLAQRRARLHPVARPDRDATALQVAVLGLPAIAVIDHHRVAAPRPAGAPPLCRMLTSSIPSRTRATVPGTGAAATAATPRRIASKSVSRKSVPP